MSRLSEILKEYTGSEDVDDVYQEVLGVLSEGDVPQIGKYYTFVYRPKTPNLRYDEYPLVAVTSIFDWGFKGINFHWGESRQYTFPEIIGGLYNITDLEIDDARNLSFGKYRLNR
tara:strand:+ start:25985 stop:26329 length:345 start_codon:yes stop_codon:yes gene_type:complete